MTSFQSYQRSCEWGCRVMRLFSVSDENRSIMARWREGLTAEQFADAMWARREAAHPCASASTGKWPFVRLENQENNVTPIRKRGKA